jgi:hypothetical protein
MDISGWSCSRLVTVLEEEKHEGEVDNEHITPFTFQFM